MFLFPYSYRLYPGVSSRFSSPFNPQQSSHRTPAACRCVAMGKEKKMKVNHTLRVTHRLLLLLEDHPFPFVRLVCLSSSLLPLVLVLLPLVVGSVGGWWHSHPSSRTPPPTTIKQGCTTRLTAVKRPSQHPPSLPSYAFLFT